MSAPCRARRLFGDDRLSWLLAFSLVVHVALIAWPHRGNGGVGSQRPTAHDAPLTATLTDAAARRTSFATRAEPRQQSQTAHPRHQTTPAPAANAIAFPALPARTVYYASDELTTKPVAQNEPALDPLELAALVAIGDVALTVWIDERGDVVDLAVDHSDLPDAFVQAAATAFRALRFAPGEVDGRQVGSVLHIEVRYELERLPRE